MFTLLIHFYSQRRASYISTFIYLQFWKSPMWMKSLILCLNEIQCFLELFFWRGEGMCSVMSHCLVPYGLLPGSSVHGIFWSRLLECVAIFSSRGSSWPRDPICIPCVSCIGRRILYHWATRSAKQRGISSVQSLSHFQLFVTPWTAVHQASLSIINSCNLLKLTSIESVMPSNHLILCRPLLLPPSIFPSIRVFSSESVLLIRWPKYWRFSISASNEYLGLISFRIDWLDLLAVQGTLKSLLQHHSSKASILQRSTFLLDQLSHPYMTNGKTIALTRWTFVGKVMTLLFNMLSRLVIAFLPRSKHLLISWLHNIQSQYSVILQPSVV